MLKSLKYLFLTLSLMFSVAANADSVQTLFHKSGDPVIGNRNGSVTMVEFFDYQCGHCIDMAPVVDALMRANPQLRIVFKELPIRGPVSEFASRAALAANKQGRYFAMYSGMMSADQPLTEKAILEIAKASALNVEQLQKDMNSTAVTKQLEANYALARETGVDGTPAFFIGKTSAKSEKSVSAILGAARRAELQAVIDKAKA